MAFRLPKPAILVLVTLVGVFLLLTIVTILARSGNDEPVENMAVREPSTEREQRPVGEQRCASQQTYDIVKRDLFRQAAELRGSDQAAFDRLAAFSVVRMQNPLVRSQNEALGTVRCTGQLSLDLPPGVAVVGGRRTLTANVDYAVQRAADGSGDVILMDGADAVVIPLATLARIPSAEPQPEFPQLPVSNDVMAPSEPPQPAPADEPQQSEAGANPSFNCRFARTRGEIAVCNDIGLAALDRQMSVLYSRSWGSAGPAERALLLRTRDRFLSYRDNCRSDSCVADAYRGRMREIRDIMAGDWQSPR